MVCPCIKNFKCNNGCPKIKLKSTLFLTTNSDFNEFFDILIKNAKLNYNKYLLKYQKNIIPKNLTHNEYIKIFLNSYKSFCLQEMN